MISWLRSKKPYLISSSSSFAAHRKHKRLAPVCHVIVCPDCTLLPALANSGGTNGEPVFCVELKPKQGFLSQGHQHCPFCLNQFLKVPFSLPIRERQIRYLVVLCRDGNNMLRERAWQQQQSIVLSSPIVFCVWFLFFFSFFYDSGSTERSSCSASTALSICFLGMTRRQSFAHHQQLKARSFFLF